MVKPPFNCCSILFFGNVRITMQIPTPHGSLCVLWSLYPNTLSSITTLRYRKYGSNGKSSKHGFSFPIQSLFFLVISFSIHLIKCTLFFVLLYMIVAFSFSYLIAFLHFYISLSIYDFNHWFSLDLILDQDLFPIIYFKLPKSIQT